MAAQPVGRGAVGVGVGEGGAPQAIAEEGVEMVAVAAAADAWGAPPADGRASVALVVAAAVKGAL